MSLEKPIVHKKSLENKPKIFKTKKWYSILPVWGWILAATISGYLSSMLGDGFIAAGLAFFMLYALIALIVSVLMWLIKKKPLVDQGLEAEQEVSNLPDKQAETSVVKRVLIGLIVLVATLFSAGLARALVNGLFENGSSNSTSDILNNNELTPYRAAQHNFVATFPGFPSTETKNNDVEGVPVPFTTYTKETDNGNKAYMIQVVEYPLSDFELAGRERSVLDSATNGFASGSGATIVTSSNDTTFLGYPSSVATMALDIEGKEYSVYTVSFVKGNNLYTIATIGVEKSLYNQFVSSFYFT